MANRKTYASAVLELSFATERIDSGLKRQHIKLRLDQYAYTFLLNVLLFNEDCHQRKEFLRCCKGSLHDPVGECSEVRQTTSIGHLQAVQTFLFKIRSSVEHFLNDFISTSTKIIIFIKGFLAYFFSL